MPIKLQDDLVLPTQELSAVLTTGWKTLTNNIAKELKAVHDNETAVESSIADYMDDDDFIGVSDIEEVVAGEFTGKHTELEAGTDEGDKTAEAPKQQPVLEIARALAKNAMILAKIIDHMESLQEDVDGGDVGSKFGDVKGYSSAQTERVAKILRWYKQIRHVHREIIRSITPSKHSFDKSQSAKKRAFDHFIGQKFFAVQPEAGGSFFEADVESLGSSPRSGNSGTCSQCEICPTCDLPIPHEKTNLLNS